MQVSVDIAWTQQAVGSNCLNFTKQTYQVALRYIIIEESKNACSIQDGHGKTERLSQLDQGIIDKLMRM
jgi:hypothetical protein